MKFVIRNLALLTVLLVLALSSGSCSSRAKGEASEPKCEPSAGYINDEGDFGIDLKVTVKNAGEAGDIRILAMLSTTEGEWKREQTLEFKKGESKELTYFFDKPTINVLRDKNSIQCRVRLSP